MSGRDELVFVPLGGVGEIGMNMAAYGFGPEGDRKWIVVDCGVTFGRPGTFPTSGSSYPGEGSIETPYALSCPTWMSYPFPTAKYSTSTPF